MNTKNVLNFAGILSDKRAKEIKNTISDLRKKSNERYLS